MTPYLFGRKLANDNAFLTAAPKAPKSPKPAVVASPTPQPLRQPQQFPSVATPKPQPGILPTPPVYQHPSGALQVGRINYLSKSAPTQQTLIGPRPAESAQPVTRLHNSAPVSPGRDSGASVLRLSHHGGGTGQYDYTNTAPNDGGNYSLVNPGLDAAGTPTGAVSGIQIGRRAGLLNPSGPAIVPPTKQNFPNAEDQYMQERLWNKRRRAAYDAALEGAALPANTNPSTLIAKACNGDPNGCSPATYARWLNAERGMHAGYANQLATMPRADSADEMTAQAAPRQPTLFDRAKTMLGFPGKPANPALPAANLTAPKPPELPPLNLNKVVMVPPGYLAAGTKERTARAMLTGLPLPNHDVGSFGAPYRAGTVQFEGGAGSPAHEYRLTRGGDPMKEQHWVDTGVYTDARENVLPFLGIGDEAKEFGRHIGLGKKLGGGDVSSYLDKIRDINNNPDATYWQKVRGNFARPVGSALQFGREVGSGVLENLQQAEQSNRAPGLGGAGIEGFSPY